MGMGIETKKKAKAAGEDDDDVKESSAVEEIECNLGSNEGTRTRGMQGFTKKGVFYNRYKSLSQYQEKIVAAFSVCAISFSTANASSIARIIYFTKRDPARVLNPGRMLNTSITHDNYASAH